MYRAGYGKKDEEQKRILAIKIRRDVFEKILREKSAGNVVIQWDPERTVDLCRLPWRTIQIGIKPWAMATYLEGIIAIEDMTPRAEMIRRLVERGEFEAAQRLLPKERPYLFDE